MSTVMVMVKDLKPGDRVDLEGDAYADPGKRNVLLGNEYQVVEKVEQETPECVCVYFTDFIGAFPTQHKVMVHVD